MFLATFCVIFVNFIGIQAEWCDEQSHSGFNSDVLSCDSFSWEKCCDTGCCPDLMPVWVTLILVFFLLGALFACCRRLLSTTTTATINTRNIVPQQRPRSNTRPPELTITLPVQQVERNVTTDVSQPITAPPSYEVATSAPPLQLDNRIPSYADALRGE